MAYATLVLGLLWSRHVETPFLVAEIITWASACVLLVRARLSRLVSLPLIIAILVIGASIVAQSYAAWRIARIGEDWPRIVASRNANMRELLAKRIGDIVTDAQRVAPLAAAASVTTDTAHLFNRLMDVHQGSKVDAMAVFGEAGQLIAWAGDHRAQLPRNVRTGSARPVFVEQPLYSYLYVPAREPGTNRHAVVAVLLATAIHEHAHDVSDDRSVANIASHLGAVFRTGPGPLDSWPLIIGTDTIAHARMTPVTQSEHRMQAIETVQRVICALAAIALILLGAAWLRRPTVRLGSTIPLLGAALALALAPLRAFGLEQLFSPALFLLPIPTDISLGTLLAILLALAALAASVQGTPRIPRWPTWLLIFGGLAVAFGYPLAIRLLVGPGADGDSIRAAGSDLLLGGPVLWFGLQLAAVLMLGIVTELGLPRWNWASPFQASSKLGSPWAAMLMGAFMTSGALSVLILMLGQTRQWVSPWFAAAWALPFTLAALGLVGYRGGGIRLMRWITAGWLAATAVLPYMWIAHVDARLQAAERELTTLGSSPDPYLDYLLMQFAREAKLRAVGGETGYLLLYRSWVASGLARENYPARLTMWTPQGLPEVQLPLGNLEDAGERPQIAPAYLDAALTRVRLNPDSVELMRVQGVPNVNEALIMALGGGRILTIEVPPRRSLEHRDIPFIPSNAPEDTHVDLVRPRPGVRMLQQAWVPTEAGWRSEKAVQFSDGDYHAHMEVRVPPLGVRIARGVLLLAFNLTLFTLLWLLGRAARGEHLGLRALWDEWRGSFRVRVTATLFFFFLIPTAVFGWVAFGALAREVTRATRIVAERAVRQAVVEFQESTNDLAELASHVGADILYYFEGELQGASSPEARDLGVYGAWMPARIYFGLTRGDEDAAVSTRQIAGQQVLTAYRALVPAGILAVPMSLESGETAVRQRELAHLILFAALMGGLLSLLLSVVVGRALTGPIGRLQRAAAQVGAGNLRVRMPEHTGDEFGLLFETFNRMVRRLRRARKQEVQTARVLAWGEMARQVAHEIKNPLTPIKLAVQHLKRAYADGKPNFGELLDENVDQILLEIDRLSEISRAFSRYGAPQASTGPLEPVNVQQVVHEALTLYRAGDPDVVYREEVEPDVPRALGRTGELKEVLINLLENARAALEGVGGDICISARATENGVEISVTDNGPGIPEDFLARVFEPHFSTRSAGTGLGLAIVRRLVESWGGAVTAESERAEGTTIRVTLRQVVTFP